MNSMRLCQRKKACTAPKDTGTITIIAAGRHRCRVAIMATRISSRTAAFNRALVVMLIVLLALVCALVMPRQAQADEPPVLDVEVTLVSEQTGELLTAEQVGDGFAIQYYAIPQSVISTIYSPSNEIIDRYFKQAQLSQPVTQLTLELEEAPSPADPVAIVFMMGTDPYGPLGSTANCTYDGTSVIIGQGITLGDDGVFHVTLMCDTSPLVNPTFTVTASTQDESAYPVYLWASFDQGSTTVGNYSYPVDTNVAVIRIDSPGDYTVEFPVAVSSNTARTHRMVFKLYEDEACTVEYPEWYEFNLGENHYYRNNDYQLYYLTIKEGDTQLLLQDGNSVDLHLARSEAAFVAPKVSFTVDDEISADQFPVYLRLFVRDDWVPELHRAVSSQLLYKIEEPGDYTVVLPTRLPVDSDCWFGVDLYKDEERLNTALNWYTPTSHVSPGTSSQYFSLGEDGTLQYGSTGDFSFLICCDETFQTPTATVDVQAGEFGVYPVNLSVRLDAYDPNKGRIYNSYASMVVEEDGVYQITFNRDVHAFTSDEIASHSNYAGTITCTLTPPGQTYMSNEPDRHWSATSETSVYVSLDQAGTILNASDNAPTVLTVRGKQSDKVWNRLWGNTALDTMLNIVKEGWQPGEVNTVVIATMSGYYDALAAAPLAGAYRAPILLTAKKTLSPQTREAISYLRASKAVIVGGPAAVSEDTEAQLVDLLGRDNVTRVEGSDAQETAVKIVAAAKKVMPSYGPSYCIVATSKSYHDALAIAPYAYSYRIPIYLTRANGTLRDDVAQAIADGGYRNVTIVGGEMAIPEATQAQLESMGLSTERLAGNDAIQTSARIASWCVANRNMNPNYMGVATSGGYHDALAGAALCGKNYSVLILVNKAGTNLYGIDNFVAGKARIINHGYVFGGEAAVNAGVFATLEETTK